LFPRRTASAAEGQAARGAAPGFSPTQHSQ
jgi:hypothetical protein